MQRDMNGSECKGICLNARGYEWVRMQGNMSMQGDMNGSECMGICLNVRGYEWV